MMLNIINTALKHKYLTPNKIPLTCTPTYKQLKNSYNC